MHGGETMNKSQEIRWNRIIKKLTDAKKELKQLAYGEWQPLNNAELEQVESALSHLTKTINCL